MKATPTSCCILSTTCQDARLLPFCKGKSMSHKFCALKLSARCMTYVGGSFSTNETCIRRQCTDNQRPKKLSQCANLVIWGWSLPMTPMYIQEVADVCIYENQRNRSYQFSPKPSQNALRFKPVFWWVIYICYFGGNWKKSWSNPPLKNGNSHVNLVWTIFVMKTWF